MKYENAINKLFSSFPMLKSVYESEGDYIKDLQHLTYSIVFAPFIRKTALENDKCMIRSICDFMEYMANTDDEMVSELLAVSVLESLLSERDVIASLRPNLGAATLKILSTMEKEYGWAELG